MSENILDWFDPHNIEHLKAYKHLEDTGCWPKDFLPDDIEMVTVWKMCLATKLADTYIENILGK